VRNRAGTGVMVVGVAAGVDDPPLRVAATTPPATAAPAMAMMAISLAEIPAPAAAPAVAATALVVRNRRAGGLSLMGRCNPHLQLALDAVGAEAVGHGAALVIGHDSQSREPLAKTPLAPWLGSRKTTAAPATGLWFSSST